MTNLKRLGKTEKAAIGSVHITVCQLQMLSVVVLAILAAASPIAWAQTLQRQTISHSSFQIDRARIASRIGGGEQQAGASSKNDWRVLPAYHPKPNRVLAFAKRHPALIGFTIGGVIGASFWKQPSCHEYPPGKNGNGVPCPKDSK